MMESSPLSTQQVSENYLKALKALSLPKSAAEARKAIQDTHSPHQLAFAVAQAALGVLVANQTALTERPVPSYKYSQGRADQQKINTFEKAARSYSLSLYGLKFSENDKVSLSNIYHQSMAYYNAHAQNTAKLLRPTFFSSLWNVTASTLKAVAVAGAVFGAGIYAHSFFCSQPEYSATCHDWQQTVLENLRSVSPQAATFVNRDWQQLAINAANLTADAATNSVNFVNSFFN